MCLGPARSTSWPPVLFLQPLVHLQLHSEGLQELIILGEQLLPQLRLLLNPGKAPRPQGGDVNSDARGWTGLHRAALPPAAAGRVQMRLAGWVRIPSRAPLPRGPAGPGLVRVLSTPCRLPRHPRGTCSLPFSARSRGSKAYRVTA